MRYFHKLQNQFWKPIINLDKVHITPACIKPWKAFVCPEAGRFVEWEVNLERRIQRGLSRCNWRNEYAC
jgi:hypothetical protein